MSTPIPPPSQGPPSPIDPSGLPSERAKARVGRDPRQVSSFKGVPILGNKKRAVEVIKIESTSTFGRGALRALVAVIKFITLAGLAQRVLRNLFKDTKYEKLFEHNVHHNPSWEDYGTLALTIGKIVGFVAISPFAVPFLLANPRDSWVTNTFFTTTETEEFSADLPDDQAEKLWEAEMVRRAQEDGFRTDDVRSAAKALNTNEETIKIGKSWALINSKTGAIALGKPDNPKENEKAKAAVEICRLLDKIQEHKLDASKETTLKALSDQLSKFDLDMELESENDYTESLEEIIDAINRFLTEEKQTTLVEEQRLTNGHTFGPAIDALNKLVKPQAHVQARDVTTIQLVHYDRKEKKWERGGAGEVETHQWVEMFEASKEEITKKAHEYAVKRFDNNLKLYAKHYKKDLQRRLKIGEKIANHRLDTRANDLLVDLGIMKAGVEPQELEFKKFDRVMRKDFGYKGAVISSPETWTRNFTKILQAVNNTLDGKQLERGKYANEPWNGVRGQLELCKRVLQGRGEERQLAVEQFKKEFKPYIDALKPRYVTINGKTGEIKVMFTLEYDTKTGKFNHSPLALHAFSPGIHWTLKEKKKIKEINERKSSPEKRYVHKRSDVTGTAESSL